MKTLVQEIFCVVVLTTLIFGVIYGLTDQDYNRKKFEVARQAAIGAIFHQWEIVQVETYGRNVLYILENEAGDRLSARNQNLPTDSIVGDKFRFEFKEKKFEFEIESSIEAFAFLKTMRQ